MILLIRTDVTGVYLEEKVKNDLLRQALKDAQTDSLTGLYNRKAAKTLISGQLEPANAISAGAFFFIDMDNFKKVNDFLGHDKGDFLLKLLSKKLSVLTPPDSIVGRFGGDESMAFAPEINQKEMIETYARSIWDAFDSLEDEEVQSIGIACSIGISLYPQDGTEYKVLSKKADEALYHAKSNGKKRFSFYSESS